MRTVASLAEVVELVDAYGTLFLRYSKGPEADRTGPSRDYEADVKMPGLSVTVVSPEPWWRRPVEDWVARRLCKYAELGEEEDRFPWLLTGCVVGNGPDHEPLVNEVQPVARVATAALEEALSVYDERFDVGQSSVGAATQPD
jgi:hypothetical protein